MSSCEYGVATDSWVTARHISWKGDTAIILAYPGLGFVFSRESSSTPWPMSDRSSSLLSPYVLAIACLRHLDGCLSSDSSSYKILTCHKLRACFRYETTDRCCTYVFQNKKLGWPIAVAKRMTNGGLHFPPLVQAGLTNPRCSQSQSPSLGIKCVTCARTRSDAVTLIADRFAFVLFFTR